MKAGLRTRNQERRTAGMNRSEAQIATSASAECPKGERSEAMPALPSHRLIRSRLTLVSPLQVSWSLSLGGARGTGRVIGAWQASRAGQGAGMPHGFTDIIESEEALRALIGEPGRLVIDKQLDYLDEHARNFIARSPFLLLGTTGADGLGDVSPRGDAPGFVQVLDERTLVIPERPGNRRADSLMNVLAGGGIGLLFLIPGIDETLRVNGHACLCRDAALLEGMAVEGKVPLLAIGVRVAECYFQCGKAFKRSKLWQPESWPQGRDGVASLAQMLHDQAKPAGLTAEELETMVAESYAKRLY